MAAIASRYARAFADVVFERKLDAAKSIADLHSLAALVASSADLRKTWDNPSISAQQKHAVLDSIIARLGVSKEVRNFLAVVIDHRRANDLAAIVRQVEQEINDRLGFAEAEITSARSLGDAEKKNLEQQVQRMTGKSLRARYTQDASLLGGAVVRVGSTIYDGSIQGQLKRLREQIAAG
jgi:F-type H+-transporting ATPase subunit delta